MEGSGSLEFVRERGFSMDQNRHNRLKINTNLDRWIESPVETRKLAKRESFDVGLSESFILKEGEEVSPRGCERIGESFGQEGMSMMMARRRETIGRLGQLKRQSLIKLSPVEMGTEEEKMGMGEGKEEREGEESLFEKMFENGRNFKNFYPKGNLNKVLEFITRVRKRNREIFCLSKKTPIFKQLRKIKSQKGNKIHPLPPLPAEKLAVSYQKLATLNVTSEVPKKLSSIFSMARNRFTTGKGLSFYQVVNEVLHNQDLRKKLQSQKLKIRKKRDF